MSIHKLTAGSGYDYLTRQVAALDATEKGHVPLASYYTERGETPGVWIGSGLAGIDGLQVGDPVTAEHMRALFGVGLHPLAAQRQQQLQGPDLSDGDYQAVTRLGAPFKIYGNDIPPFRVEVATRIAELNAAAGLPRDWPVPRSERARVRTEVARELFAAEHGRPPQDARELAAAIAKHSRPQTTAVAGYDLTFSPVKSVSTLWALSEPAVAAQIEKAHRAAASDALSFIEQHALFSRTGANGIRQVDGLVHWMLIVVGMMWQFVVSLAILRHELGGLHWPSIKKRIWLNLPRDPRTGKTRKVLFLWALPAIAANALGAYLASYLDTAWTNLVPALREPSYVRIEGLADPQFQGQWWILGLALTSLLFNYFLGEELLFHGVLLPRMAGVFGRWDWIANTVLFGLYHVHKIWFWPSMIASSFGYAWAARRFRSLWMSVIVHGIEGYFIVMVVAVLAGWYP